MEAQANLLDYIMDTLYDMKGGSLDSAVDYIDVAFSAVSPVV